ncbi:MAG: WD40 repeat domain-containing protein, partial [Nitrospinales bacterium]
MDTDTQLLRTRYPGSSPFTKNYARVFYGRGDDIDKLITKINVEKIIILYSKSGLGKSSLLNAGVLPEIEDQYFIIPLRFGMPAHDDIKHPLDILDQQLSENYYRESFLNKIEPENFSLWQYIKNLQITNPDPMTFLLVFDQFEELFSFSHGVIEFAEAIGELLYNRCPKDFQRALHLAESTMAGRLPIEDREIIERPLDVKVLMAIRSDRMSMLDRLSVHIPNLLNSDSLYELKHLSWEQAEGAISSPAQKEGKFLSERFGYHEDTLQKMLVYLTQNRQKPVESFQLQILCQYVEENIVGKQKNVIVKPVDLGDPKGIFRDFYDRTIQNIGTSAEQLKSHRFIEDGLIFEEEEKRISLFEGQIEKRFDISKELLNKIVHTHIIRREKHGGGHMYELSHDSLVAPILRAKDQRRHKEQKWKAEAKRRKEEEKRRKEEAKKRKAKLDELELQMANQKVAYKARSAKRARLFAIALGVLVLMILGALIRIYFLQQRLADKLILSNARVRVENANQQIKQSWPQLSLLLARQAYLINKPAKGPIASLVHSGLRKFLDPDFLIQELPHDDIVGPVAFSPDGKKLATGSSERGDKIIYLWDLDNLDAQPIPLSGHTGEIYALVFSRNGEFLASAGEDGTVRLWEFDLKKPVAMPTLLKSITANMGKVWAVAFNPVKNMLAAAGEDNIVRLWDLKDLKATPTPLEGHTDSVLSVVFSLDGKKLASGCRDTKIRLWDLENPKKEPVVLEGHGDSILSLAFDRDGKFLASGSYDNTVRLWNMDDPSIASNIFKGHQKAVRSVAFSPDGKRLASGSYDRTVRLWDLKNPDADPEVLTGHKDYIFSVAFSPGGEVLASGSQDKTARLWYLKRASTFTVIQGHEKTVSAVALSPDGKT